MPLIKKAIVNFIALLWKRQIDRQVDKQRDRYKDKIDLNYFNFCKIITKTSMYQSR